MTVPAHVRAWLESLRESKASREASIVNPAPSSAVPDRSEP